MNKHLMNSIKIIFVGIAYMYFLNYVLNTKKISELINDENIQLIIFLLSFLVIIFYIILKVQNFSIKLLLKNKEFLFYIPGIFILLYLFDYIFSYNFTYFLQFIENSVIKLLNIYGFSLGISILIILYLVYFDFRLLILKKLINTGETKNKGFLISDKPVEDKEDDKLGYTEKAESFAHSIFNDGSDKGFVYGLVASWGLGKSSFLNLVKKEFKDNDNYKGEVEVFEFNPWYYESESLLLEKFLVEFKSFIKNNTDLYLPDLENDLDLLINLLEKEVNSIFGINFSFSTKKDLEDIRNSINISLGKIDKKIVIIIDDLDRISSEKLKTIFKIVDLCKSFYNTNFVLCYDLQNFNNIDESLKETRIISEEKISTSTENVDNKNLVRYIEKIVNVQYNLYLDFDKLKKYFEVIFLEGDIRFSENSKDGIKEGIERLFEIKSFRIWGKHLSDVRSIKRIYNNILSLVKNNELRTKYIKVIFDKNQGIFFDKFIRLWILQLSYNKLFNDIYSEVSLSKKYDFDLEYGGNTNKFTLESKIADNGIYYYSKGNYDAYSFEEKQLISNLFPLIIRKEPNKGEQNIDVRDIRVGDNLKKYLNIINMNFGDFDNEIRYFNFIEDKLSNFYNSEKSLKEIITEIEIKYGEKGIKDFINKIKANIYSWKNKNEKGLEFLDYSLENFYIYSLNGLLNSYYYDIVEILNNSAPYSEKPNQDYKYMANFMYGIDEYKGKGILDRLFNDKWGIIGLEVAIGLFYFLNGRNLNLIAVRKGLVENEEINMPNKFYSAKIARYVYEYFKNKYSKRLNIFKEIDSLDNKKLSIDNGLSTFREFTTKGLRNFIIYQLTAEIGYFDSIDDKSKWSEYEKQENGIKKELNKYYFEKCFNGEDIKYFIDYLSSFVNQSKNVNDKYQVVRSINEQDLYNVFDKELLLKFIKERKDDISKYIDLHINEVCFTTRYSDSEEGNIAIELTYGEFYKLLNELKNLEVSNI